jgi:hypothetical protein
LRSFIKNITVVFLCLAGAVIIAHSVIPHDHHPDVSVYEDDISCKGSTENSHSHFPFHCHALNDLVCEKFTFSSVFISDSFPLIGTAAVNEMNDCSNIFTSCRLKFLEVRIPLPGAFCLGNDLLRAPPAII